jgi:hypothetical protein
MDDKLKILERFTAYALSIGLVGGLVHMAMNSISVPTWYWGVLTAVASWAGIPAVFNGVKALKKWRQK